ncbi:neogenin 1a isoform X3 [Pangasianodon hypophthalmus]|uniref:neogenin 1a isoform X3 n=1 Tax=Pangasianodon hypophthalmus TaxID=310915 RepID=UPI002306E386|nr:neogenin 1a isoform X3 [Pangasianodon hypophthalmus]
MAERGARVLLSLLCLTSACSLAPARAQKGSVKRHFSPFWFSVEPSDTLAVRGSPALLNCSVYSELPARVHWKKDGVLLNPDDRRQVLPDGSLLISSIMHSKHNKPDEGVYQCVATIENLGTISSRTARLNVAGTPRFSGQPEAASVHLGESWVLSCEVNADLVSFIRWERDKEPVPLDQRVYTLPSGALVISNATEVDAGLYRCVLENAGPTKNSDEAELQILPETWEVRKLEFLRQPGSVSRVVGESVLLPCVVSGFPAAYVRWMRDDRVIDDSDNRFELLGGGSLQIFNLTEEDGGIYSCLADNANDSIEARAELTVQVPPQFLKRPTNTYAHEATDIVFECEATGSPAPTIKWVKNGDAVVPSDYFRILKEQNLQVQGLVKTDEGFYQCLAENEVGNVQASAQLIILDQATPSPSPTLIRATADRVTPGSGGSSGSNPGPGLGPGPVPSAPRDVVASLVSTRFIKLTWRLPLEPHGDDITYSVYYGLEGAKRERTVNTSRPGEMQVTIQNLKPDTKYSFRVVAYNKHGRGESSAPLKVATQPEVQVPGPAPNFQAVVQTSTSVSLSWDKPLTGNGDIQNYRVYYMEKSLGNEKDIEVSGLSYTMSGLKKFTEYNFRVVAYNKHGPGVSTDDVSVRTYSDVPSAAPQNMTVEVVNSKSIMVRWQPPPADAQNGEIIDYKIRYKKGTRKSEPLEITSGNQLSKLIDGLQRGTEYSVRVSAITVNGSGPATDWATAETFESDLDESRVPDVPGSLHVRPLVNSIVVSWSPPENQDIVVRGYIIGYGIGNPHSQTIKLDYKQRYYNIENLDPSSHYVITLKAFNNVGEGIPVYESALTRPQTDPIDPDVDLYELFHPPYTPVPDPIPMMPPVGVQASVLSHDTIKVTWADNSLPKNQKITDARYYTVRWKTNIPANTKFKTANTTNLSHMVTGLKPNTLYEFSVMVTKGRKTSTWSMTAHGTTLEATPSSAPKDVTVVSKEGRPRTIIVNWQPPSEANGKITGYIIYYSTDVNAEVHDWVIEPVVGNRLTHQIQELTLDTAYYFKIQARNSKGMGPMSEAVQFRTLKAESSDKMANDQASGIPGKPGRAATLDPGKSGMPGSENHILVIVIIVSVGGFIIIALVVGALLCSRRSTSQQKKKRAACKSSNGSHKYKGNSKDLKPPDLWIHHERLELKPIDKSPEPNPVMTDTPIPRSSQDITPVDGTMDPILQRRNSYRGHESEESMSTLAGRRGMRPKMMMPFDAQPPQPVISAHPIHSLDNHHHHYHLGSLASPTHNYLQHTSSPRPLTSSISYLDRAESPESVRNTPTTDLLPASAQPSCSIDHSETDISYHSSAAEDEPSYNPPTAHVRPTHPLKSFAVPSVPAHGSAYEGVALPNTPLLSQTGPHSVKTASIGTLGRTRTPMPVIVPNAPDVPDSSRMLEECESKYEKDELSEEMAHLEGLMKDLNAITTA